MTINPAGLQHENCHAIKSLHDNWNTLKKENELHGRRQMTWRSVCPRRSADHEPTQLLLFIIISKTCSIYFNRVSISSRFRVIRPQAHKHIGVTTLTFQGHVTSSIRPTWPFDSPYAISYWWSIGTHRYLQPFSIYSAPKMTTNILTNELTDQPINTMDHGSHYLTRNMRQSSTQAARRHKSDSKDNWGSWNSSRSNAI